MQRKPIWGMWRRMCWSPRRWGRKPRSSVLTRLKPSVTAVKNLVSSWCLSVERRTQPWRNVWHDTTRTPRFSKSASRSTFERSWNLRGRGFQPRTRNKNFRLACKKTTQQALFLKCTQTCALPRTAGYVAVLWTSGCISCKATCLYVGKRWVKLFGS